MAYPAPNTINHTEGLNAIFVYANEVTNGIFSMMLLVTLFIIVAFGTYFSAKRTTGQGDFVASFAVAGYFTVGAAFIMLLIEGLMTVPTVLLALVVSIVGTIWLWFDRRA